MASRRSKKIIRNSSWRVLIDKIGAKASSKIISHSMFKKAIVLLRRSVWQRAIISLGDKWVNWRIIMGEIPQPKLTRRLVRLGVKTKSTRKLLFRRVWSTPRLTAPTNNLKRFNINLKIGQCPIRRWHSPSSMVSSREPWSPELTALRKCLKYVITMRSKPGRHRKS